MKNIELVKPKLNQYYYEAKLEGDSNTMGYNAGYDVTYEGYHYDTGCIDFPKSKWKDTYRKRANENSFFAYIKDCSINRYVGYVNYHYNEKDNIYECGILIEYKYRNRGYSRDALRLLIREAYNNKIEYLYDTFEKDRPNALKVFSDLGFEVYKETSWKKFNKKVNGVVVRIKTDKVLPDIDSVKNIDDVLDFMKKNIRYGWIDINNKIHISNMKGFRKLYRTLSIDEMLKYGVGTCIDQVYLMKCIFDRIGVKNKMFCTRIYEPNSFDKVDADEHMHCFILCYVGDKVYHLEHPNWYRIGITEYKSEDEALKFINDYYVKLSGGVSRPITEFYKVEEGLTFKEFNNYINNLDISLRKLNDTKEDYLKLYNWCQNRFVYEWFEQRTLTYTEIVNKYRKKINDGNQDLFIIESAGIDIGLVQIYKFDDDIDLNISEAYEFDLFIGEDKYLNKGIGRKVIEYVTNKVFNEYNGEAIILRPFKRNIKAVRCYEKCGYKKIKEYVGIDTLGNKEKVLVLIRRKK